MQEILSHRWAGLTFAFGNKCINQANEVDLLINLVRQPKSAKLSFLVITSKKDEAKFVNYENVI